MMLRFRFLRHGLYDLSSRDQLPRDANSYHLFAPIPGPGVTLREVVVAWLCDFETSGVSKHVPRSITTERVLDAILGALGDQTWEDYYQDRPFEVVRNYTADEWAELGKLLGCPAVVGVLTIN